MGVKAETVSTSTSVSWGWQLTPNIYVGGERQGQRGQGKRENDRMTMCHALCFRTTVWMPRLMDKSCKIDQINQLKEE